MELRVRGVFFVDLDGTLVGPDGIADRVWPALAALRAAGHRIAVCTGRPGRGIALDVARAVDPDGLHVFESGAVVMHASGTLVAHHPIPPGAVAAIAHLSLARGATLEAYTADARYLARERDAFIAAHEDLLGVPADIVAWPPDEALVRLQWVVPHAAWPALAHAASGALDGISAHEGRSPRMPGVSFVSMVAAGISKATGMTTVLDHYGVDARAAAMAGDNLNDLEALDLVGTAFVPTDGVPEALARADIIVPSAADGGVADAAHHLLANAR